MNRFFIQEALRQCITKGVAAKILSRAFASLEKGEKVLGKNFRSLSKKILTFLSGRGASCYFGSTFASIEKTIRF